MFVWNVTVNPSHVVCGGSVHLRVEEKMTLTAGREGGLQNLEVHGIITLKITNDKFGRIKVAVRNSDTKGIQLQVSHDFGFVLFILARFTKKILGQT